jgi:hypothetical protein
MRVLTRLLILTTVLGVFTATPTARQLPTLLLQQVHLIYVGSFRVPQGQLGSSRFDGGGTSMSYDATNNSLWIAGLGQSQLAELNIPTPTIAGTVGGLPTATLRTTFRSVVNLAQLQCSEALLLGGSLPWLGNLIVSAYCYFEGGAETRSHWRVASGGTGSAVGPFQVGTVGAGFVSAQMTPIPAVWRASFGGPALTSQWSIPIINRTSSGPAASVFDPAVVGAGGTVPAVPVVGYPYDDAGSMQTIGRADSDGTLWSSTQHAGGLVFPENTASVLFFGGRKAKGPFCYGNGTSTESLHGTDPDGPGGEDQWCYDPVNHDKGTHGYPYAHFVYAYRATDLLDVKNGVKQRWQIVPYSTWEFDLPFQHGQRVIPGVAYDPATQRIYMSALNGDGDYPLIHVFRVDTSGTGGDVTPPTVSLGASSLSFALGGSSTLTATAADNVGVVTVDFTVNGVVERIDTTAPFTFTWTPTADGSYSLRAIARDAAGNSGQSNILTATVTPGAPPPGDTTSPTVSLAASTLSMTLGDSSTLTATASDDVGVTSVDFLGNGNVLFTDTVAPYTYVATPGTLGNFDLQAIAHDAAGNQGQSAVLVLTVNAPPPPPPDTTPPTATLNATPTTITLGASTALSASASDNVGVARVSFRANNVEFASDTSVPYTASYTPVTSGTIALTAVAFDAVNNPGVSNTVTLTVNPVPPPPPPVDCVVSEWSEWSAWMPISSTMESRTRTRTILVAPANGGAPCPTLTETETRLIPVIPPPPPPDPDTTAPTVTLSAPTAATVGVSIALSASASDNVAVTRVEFRRDGQTIAADLIAPYTTTWAPSTGGVSVVLQAFAFDAAGNIGSSNTITVVVAPVVEPPPPPPPGLPTINVTIQITYCRITIPAFNGTPDGQTGWRVQIRRNNDNLGSGDIKEPFGPMTAQVPVGSYVLIARWTKSGQLPIFQPLGTWVCPSAIAGTP